MQVCVQGQAGRLFTLFLTSPVMGMAALAKLKDADGLMLAACQVRNNLSRKAGSPYQSSV